MGVRVSTRTVWFAVCQACTRRHIAAGGPVGIGVLPKAFDSENERTLWSVEHGQLCGIDLVVWETTAGVPDLVAGKDKSVS